MKILGVCGKCALLIIIVFAFTECQKVRSIDKTFQKGVKAYNEERWSKCIDQFEEALHLYKLYKSVLLNCRMKCNSEVKESQVKESFDDLKIYEHFFNKRDCIIKCQDLGFQAIKMSNALEDSALYNMQNMKPYEYLHICYFQMRMFHKAVASAYTYLVANPTDETMKSNLKHYMEMPEVDPNDAVDLESDDYVFLYMMAKGSYKQENWAETVASMEEALKDYMSSENKCRVECERQPGQEASPEFVMTISNNMASLLHCRQQCQDKLKLLDYNSGVEFLADVLNYIQISYYHLERYEEAAQSVASSLVLMPHDEDMLVNEKFYSEYVDEKAFKQRSDIVHYFKRDSYEKSLLDFFHQGKNNNVDPNTV